uniref:Large ribosomal subunit protein uL22c n=1 Tax=Dichotomaria marginata TaxID=268567 RepID=A0A1G4NSH0_9FLOR|nr:Ribosomal protein L22 [Dichotomaria marginata]SCW21597.1 Ribosomal protein L22 [Dichotomaria marginata]
MTETIENITATSKYLRLSPYKVNRILNQIRGKTYPEAMLILQFMPYRGCINIRKILNSAACNAQHNYGMNKQNLKIKQAFVNKGPKLKRFQPRAQGRAFPIHKPTCHVTISVINLIAQ